MTLSFIKIQTINSLEELASYSFQIGWIKKIHIVLCSSEISTVLKMGFMWVSYNNTFDSILQSETFDNDYFDIFDKLIEIETGVKT
jgi:hypothetical protein